MSTLEDCPSGSYCPANSSAEVKCLKGTFNDQTNGKSFSDCKSCPGGKYCAIDGLTAPTGDIAAGYYSKTGATSATPPNAG
jgi:hypothetical protein